MTLKTEGPGGHAPRAYGVENSWEAIEAPKSIKSTAGLPAGNAGTFQTVGDVAARVVSRLARQIGADCDL
jgi:hypothetical protein